MKHGDTRSDGYRTAEYITWVGMNQRCVNPSASGYDRYGGRGIRVCERWRGSYEAFLEDMGRKPSRAHTIERRDNNGHYEPRNCKWAVLAEQARNRRNNNKITAFGQTRCITDWAVRIGVAPSTVVRRMKLGWSSEDAVSLPPRTQRRTEVTHDGVCMSVGKWARKTGLRAQTIMHRLDCGWTVGDALTSKPGALGVGRPTAVFLTAFGETLSVAEWTRRLGVARNTIRERLARGWAIERAVTTKSTRRKGP